MTPDLLHQLPAIILAGVCTYVWLVARDRRKAVDRLRESIDEAWTEKDYPDKTAFRCGCHKRIERYIAMRSDDAAGRVIARSVKRVTKENDER